MNDRKGTTWNFLLAWQEYDNALVSATSLNPDGLAKNPSLNELLSRRDPNTMGGLIYSPETRIQLAMKLALAELSRS